MLQSIDASSTTVVFSLGGVAIGAWTLFKLGTLAGRYDAKIDRMTERLEALELGQKRLIPRDEISGRLDNIEMMTRLLVSKLGVPFQDRHGHVIGLTDDPARTLQQTER